MLFGFVVFFAFLFSLVVTYVSRMYLAGDRVATGDTFFHLLISESIKANHWHYPTSLRNVTFDEAERKYSYLAYPPLFHYLIAIFPEKHFLRVSRTLNLVIISLVSTLAAGLVYFMFGNVFATLFACLVVTFNMSVFELEAMFTPRPLGLLLYSLIFFFAVFSGQGWASVVIIVLVGSLLFLTHKFAVQALVFVLVPYAVLFNEPFLVLGLMFAFLLAFIVSRGSYLKILKEHTYWLYFYFRLPNRMKIIYKLQRIVVGNLWLFAVASLLVLGFLGGVGGVFQLSSLSLKVLFWAFAPLAGALIVAIPQISFLGEEYRYIEYSLVPTAIAAAFLFVGLSIYATIISVVCLGAYLVVMAKYRTHLHKKRELVGESDLSTYRSLKNRGLANVLVFPPIRTLEFNYFTHIKVLHSVRHKDVAEADHLKHLLADYKVDYLLRFDRLDDDARWSVFAGMGRLEKVDSYNDITLYKLSS